MEYFRGHTGGSLLEAYRRRQAGFYPGTDTSEVHRGRFFKNLFRYMSYLLDVPETAIYQHAAHTNLVKCSTLNEQDSLEPQTMEECYQRYFKRELALFTPRVWYVSTSLRQLRVEFRV
jgi:hypothetical protein